MRPMSFGMKLQVFGERFHYGLLRNKDVRQDSIRALARTFGQLPPLPRLRAGSLKTSRTCFILVSSRRFPCRSGLITCLVFLRLFRPSWWESVAGRVGFWPPLIARLVVSSVSGRHNSASFRLTFSALRFTRSIFAPGASLRLTEGAPVCPQQDMPLLHGVHNPQN